MTDIPRRKKFSAPPAAAAHDRGALPPRPGTVLGHVPLEAVRGQRELTEVERKIIEKAAWTPGQPAPAFGVVGQHMDAAVAAVQAKAEDHFGMMPIDPATLPLEMPEPVDIEDMAPDERAKAVETFKEMDALQDRMNEVRRARARAQAAGGAMSKPGGAVALAAAAAAARQQAEAPPTEQLPFKLKDAKPPVQATPESTPEPTPESCSHDQNSADAGADLTGATITCPQCNFDLNSELVEPTTEDIASYLSALMGEGRFRKEVKLFGGRVVIVFRGLLPREVDLALRLADAEAASGNVQHIMQYARFAEGFKLVMGIETVKRAGQPPIDLPEIGEIVDEPDGPTPVMQLKDYLDNEVFTTDSLRRTVGTQWIKFNRLLQFMEAKAEDPDFFGAIA